MWLLLSLRVLNFKERSVWAGGKKKEKPREASNANNKIAVRVGIALFLLLYLSSTAIKAASAHFKTVLNKKALRKMNFLLVARAKIMSACNKSPYLCMEMCARLRVCACVHARGCVSSMEKDSDC